MFKLTNEQENALNLILNFLNEPYDKEFLLTGCGGAGKTSIIKFFLHQQTKIKNHQIVIAAPTHKACNVINNILNNEYTVITIHKLLGFSKDIDEYGNIVFKRKFQNVFSNFKLIIIDECSMVKAHMYNKINDYFEHSKKLYLGDSFQLPPIKENVSPTFNICNCTHLSKVMRYSNHILEFNNNLRKNINKKNLQLKKLFQNNYINSKDILYTQNPTDFKQLINIAFKKERDAKVLCWTNKQVDKYNTSIRKSLYGKNIQRFCNGEKVLVTNHYVTLDSDGKNSYIPRIFYSNDELIANNVNIIDYEIKYLSKIVKLDVLNKLNIKSLKLWKFDIVGNLLHHKSLNKIKHYIFKRKPFIGNEILDIIINYSKKDDDKASCFFFKIHKDSESDFDNILTTYYNDALNWTKMYSNTPNDNTKTFAKKKWKDYYSIKEHFDAPITYNYSSTIHRAQGSQYDYVFIDIEDINKNRKIEERNKLIYVASSRSCKKLILFE